MVLMITGARKTGKSYMCSHLLRQAASLRSEIRPDLVICCCGGSQADYVPIIREHWDDRFLFDRLPGPQFMQQLFDQQRALDANGQRRQVLIIMDDAPVDKDTRNAIIEVGFRGRHYGVSLWILAISFVMAPKPLRRSLDALIILSGLPLASDRKALTEDFCGRAPEHALWALENLRVHEALVCILTKGRFSMYVYRARNFTGPAIKEKDAQPMARAREESEDPEEVQGEELQGGSESSGPHVQEKGGYEDEEAEEDGQAEEVF